MAVATIDSVVSDVMFVTELHGLFACKECLCVIRGPVKLKKHPECDAAEEDCPEDRRPRDEVGASMKSLAHNFGPQGSLGESRVDSFLADRG